MRNQNKIKIAPSKGRILNLTHEQLVGHYNLVRLKKSTLSSAQRDLVERRVAFLISKNKISQIEVDLQLARLKDMVGLNNYEPK